MPRLLFLVFFPTTKNGLSPAYTLDAKLLLRGKIYDMGVEEYNDGLIF